MSMLLAAAADAANAAQAAAPIVPDFAQKALVFAAAFSMHRTCPRRSSC